MTARLGRKERWVDGRHDIHHGHDKRQSGRWSYQVQRMDEVDAASDRFSRGPAGDPPRGVQSPKRELDPSHAPIQVSVTPGSERPNLDVATLSQPP
jgi:hypothetical protein